MAIRSFFLLRKSLSRIQHFLRIFRGKSPIWYGLEDLCVKTAPCMLFDRYLAGNFYMLRARRKTFTITIWLCKRAIVRGKSFIIGFFCGFVAKRVIYIIGTTRLSRYYWTPTHTCVCLYVLSSSWQYTHTHTHVCVCICIMHKHRHMRPHMHTCGREHTSPPCMYL